LVIDVGLGFLVIPKNSIVFPELARRNRVYLFSGVTAFTLLLLIVLVYSLLWDLAIYYVLAKFLVIQLFSSYVSSSPGVLQEPFRLLNVYQGLNGLVLDFTGIITGFTNVVDRIFLVVGLRYFYLLSATERSSRVRFLRIPVAVAPAIYLVEVFHLAGSPVTYVVSATIYCVLIPILIFEAIVLGTSATLRIGERRIPVSQFDVIRKLMTWDILKDASQVDSLSLTGFSQKVRVWTGVVSFKDSVKGDSSLIIVPSLHPGPLLSFGGSLLSYKISESLKDDYSMVMVPHSPSTHDFNPASASEISTIVDDVHGILESGKVGFYEFASPILVEEGSRNGNKFRVFCQAFGSGRNQKVLIFCDLQGENNGDISYGVGNYLVEAAKSEGAKDAIIVDKHFLPHRNERPLYMEDPFTEELKELVKKAVKNALKAEKSRILFAGAKMTRQEIKMENKKLAREIGRDGITLYVLKLENTDEKLAYVLIDANTVEPELGRKILNLFLKSGFKENNVLIMTSDTHQDLLFLKSFGSNEKIHEPFITTLKKLLKIASKPRKVTVSINRIMSDVNVWGLLNGERFFTLLLRAFPKATAALVIYWIVALILSLLIL
jgi:predicted neutral ceramidase superfamily lipid hydrolase